MRVSSTKPAPRVEQNQYNTKYRIKNYGLGNDYPQKLIDIFGSSGTGASCIDIYCTHVEGNGFVELSLNDAVLNKKGERASKLLRKIAHDLPRFGGFAVLVKYNGMMEKDEFYHVPFEHCRLEIDKDKNLTGRVAVHPDWTGINGRTFKTDDIKYINRYNPATVSAEMQEVGGPVNYLGQIYYFTLSGDFQYPICPFDPIITDMLTEESVSTVKHRNAKNNFLPAGVLVRKGIKPPTNADGSIDESNPLNRQNQESADELKKWQGDQNACKMLVVDIDTDEEKPEFIAFEAKNLDRQFEKTEPTVQENIARMFKIPPILRGVDVGAGFGAELIENAFIYMNSNTQRERNAIREVFMDLMTDYRQQFSNYDIDPLHYLVTTQAIPAQQTDQTVTT